MKNFSKGLMQLILINVIQQDITGERPVPDRFIIQVPMGLFKNPINFGVNRLTFDPSRGQSFLFPFIIQVPDFKSFLQLAGICSKQGCY